MVDVVGRIPDARRRTGLNGGRPLHVRFQEALQIAAREIPTNDIGRQCLTLMESELNLDMIYSAIEASRQRRAPREPDAATREAMSELYHLKVEFNRCALEMKSNQNWLQYARTDWRHQILGLHPDCFTPPPGVFSTAVGEDKFDDAYQARAAVAEMHKRLAWIRGICALMSASKSFEAQPPGEQSIRLMQAFAARKLEADARIEALEAACMALNARLSQLERGKKSKTRSTPHTKRK
jgi:hypothetical protein